MYRSFFKPLTEKLLRRLFAEGEVQDVEAQVALEAVYDYANLNQKITSNVVGYLRRCLETQTGPSWIVPAHGVVMRGDHTPPEILQRNVGEELAQTGSKSVTLRLYPGSSWTYDAEQATYHGTSGTLIPEAEVIYTAQTSTGMWLDLRELYKTSRLRGLRFEREVINLDTTVRCKAEWKLPSA